MAHGEFVVIGFGSLLWDLDCLAPHVSLPWQMGKGPALPMEFSRVSPKRKMGLAVVLDAAHGATCPTHFVPSKRKQIKDVVADLAIREHCAIEHIGAVCMQSGCRAGHSAAILDRVSDWCRHHQMTGAVWTDIAPNFQDHTGQSFSITNAISYLQSLQGAGLREAIRYIDNAPAATKTPLRTALEKNAWWQALPRDA